MINRIETEWFPRSCDVCGEGFELRELGHRTLGLQADNEVYVFEQHDTIRLSCGFMFNGKVPSQDFIDTYYENTSIRIGADYNAANRIGLIERFFSVGDSLLEIGAGRGEFCDTLNTLGYHVEGIEIGQSTSNKYNGVLAYYVLEHVIDPNELVGRMRDCLNDNGILIIEVPDALNHPKHSFYLEHLSHFTVNHLAALLLRHDFQVLEVHLAHSRDFGFAIVAKKGFVNRLAADYHRTMEEIRLHWNVD